MTGVNGVITKSSTGIINVINDYNRHLNDCSQSRDQMHFTGVFEILEEATGKQMHPGWLFEMMMRRRTAAASITALRFKVA